MKPSQQQNTNDRMMPRPMRAGRLTRQLLGTTGIVIATAGTECRLIGLEEQQTLGVPEMTETQWSDDLPTDWESYISQS